MSRLIERELAAVGKLQRGEQSPASVGDRLRERDPLVLELGHRRVQIVGDEVELVTRRNARPLSASVEKMITWAPVITAARTLTETATRSAPMSPAHC